MSAMSYLITSLTIVYSTVYSGADQRRHQNSASLAFVRGIHRSLVTPPPHTHTHTPHPPKPPHPHPPHPPHPTPTHKGPVTRKRFPFDDVIMWTDRPTSSWWLQICWCQANSNNHADSSIISCTHVGNNAGKMSAGRQTFNFLIAGGLVLLQWWMSVVSKAHRPGNAIMMAVNGLAPKRHQYTSEHHSESSAIPVYSSSLKPCYTTYIPHYSHWTRNVKGSSVGWQPACSFVVGRIGFSHR